MAIAIQAIPRRKCCTFLNTNLNGLTAKVESCQPGKAVFVESNSSKKTVLNLNELDNLSLRFDLLAGWKPQLGIKKPFPIIYSDPFTETLREKPDFIYKGVRHRHSFELHKGYSSSESYYVSHESFRLFTEAESKGLLTIKMPCPESKPDKLSFDSNFEGGNCDLVKKNLQAADTYDIYLKPDTSTRGHAQWFYFSVTASAPIRATFLIRNMCKPQSMFSKGATPFFSHDNKNWRMLDKADYFESTFLPSEDCRPQNYRKLNTLRYTYNFSRHEQVFFSYCPPYTLGKLQSTVRYFVNNCHPTINVRHEQLCLGLSGLGVPIIQCTEASSVSPILPEEDRPAIFVIARVHPGETCGSHMMHGFLREIFSNSEAARCLRELFIFYVVPMMNPDGVVVGNFRTDLVGDDMNRQYIKPSVKYHPSVVSLRTYLQEVKLQRKVVGLLDLHGHSTRPGVFTYGPQLASSDSLYEFTKVFPWMVAQKTSMFKFEKCTYTVPKQKLSTARAYFLFKKGSCYLRSRQVRLHSRSQRRRVHQT